MAYRTPDVYVKELSVFPPSVAEVESAIPAFVGYTERADEYSRSLLNVPTEVKSLPDFIRLFGAGARPVITEVTLDENNTVRGSTVENRYFLYDAIQLFFLNGGGRCYVVSVGKYPASVDKSDLSTGLATLAKKDEPTILLFPDAVKLDKDAFHALQVEALLQCAKLGDRVAVLDLRESDANDASYDWQDGVTDFRQNIGMNNLKYGAAYTPWLKTNLGLDVSYRDFGSKLKRASVSLSLKSLTTEATVAQTVDDLDVAVSNLAAVNAVPLDSFGAQFTALLDTARERADGASFTPVLSKLHELVEQFDAWDGAFTVSSGAGSTGTLKDDLALQISSVVAPVVSELVGWEAAMDDLAPDFSTFDNAALEAARNAPVTESIFVGADQAARIRASLPPLDGSFRKLVTALSAVRTSALNYVTGLENRLYETHPIYKGIVQSLNTSLTLCPPSGAVAGVYAQIDSARGVWKSPANVSLAGVVSPTVLLDSLDQESLNVDPVAGKSINAIRAFTGKGTMVWGARTLAGNDNEWRYVSVRRFFNLVEESVKKSTYWSVFEPNDANTWIKVKSMIENYLLQKFREGALQGSKPDQAFFVRVGLGVTMTAQDVLEGVMNVAIGMAAVRPAEFIVLTFSHKLPQI
jgi:phage tail sheath protein FI